MNEPKQKVWVTVDGILGTAHWSRNDRWADFRPGEFVLVEETLGHKVPRARVLPSKGIEAPILKARVLKLTRNSSSKRFGRYLKGVYAVAIEVRRQGTFTLPTPRFIRHTMEAERWLSRELKKRDKLARERKNRQVRKERSRQKRRDNEARLKLAREVRKHRAELRKRLEDLPTEVTAALNSHRRRAALRRWLKKPSIWTGAFRIPPHPGNPTRWDRNFRERYLSALESHIRAAITQFEDGVRERTRKAREEWEAKQA